MGVSWNGLAIASFHDDGKSVVVMEYLAGWESVLFYLCLPEPANRG